METTLDAQGGLIAQKASQIVVDAQGVTLREAGTRLSAVEGSVRTAVTAAGTGAVNSAVLPRMLSQLGDLLLGQIGAISQNIARAETNTSATFDETGRAIAEVSTRLLAYQGDASAQFVAVTQAIAGTSEALVQARTLLSAQFDQVAADIVREERIRAAADAASTTRVDEAVSRIGTAEGRITGLDQTFASEKAANAESFRVTGARIGETEAGVRRLDQASIDDRRSTAQSFESVVATLDKHTADIRYLDQVTIDDRASYTQSFRDIVAKFGTTDTRISDLATAQSTATSAQAETNRVLSAATEAGTASGQFQMAVVSAPGEVTARIAAFVSANRGGANRFGGFFLDLLPNGTTRYVIDANLFAITANGGVSYPFTFDGQTLRVPNLVLTSGQASVPLRIDIGSYTLVAGPGTLNDAIDANLNFVYTVANPDFPANIEVFGKVTISGPPGTQLLGMRLIVDGVMSGYFRFNEQATSISTGPNPSTFDFRCSCIRYLPAGNRSVRIQYSYTSPGAGQVQINELHLAGFQPKA